jgi:diguanylate cyclase (GGDEF)-like protein/PAS domain S-box-containing protein
LVKEALDMSEHKGASWWGSLRLFVSSPLREPRKLDPAPPDPTLSESVPSSLAESRTTRLRQLRQLAVLAGITAVYFVGGKLGLQLAFVHPSVTAVWPPTGIALAALLIFGTRVWPAIVLGAFLVNLTTPVSVATTIGITIGNTLEALAGAFLVTQLARGRNAFDRARDIFNFAILAGMLTTMVSATFGATSLCAGGFARWPDFGSIWLTWWLGDAVGALVVGPLLILWMSHPRVLWKRDQIVEACLLLLSLYLVSQAVFSGATLPGIPSHALEFLCVPFLVWAAFRFGPREVATAILVLSAVAIRGTLRGLGPFAVGSQNDSLLLLQVFVGVTGVVAMVVAASVSERRQAADRFRLVVESAPNAMVMAGEHGEIVLVNSQAEKLFGYKREEMIGQPIEMLLPQRFRELHPAHRAGFAAQPGARPMGAGRDLYALRKDGSEFPVEIGLNPIETEEGTLVLGAIMDITERKRTELAMKEINATLLASVSKLEQQSREIALLNQMSHLLQTCQSTEEAHAVIQQFAAELFPTDSGAVFVLNTSVDLVEAVCVWGDSPPAEQVFSPRECWALRRGQVHAAREGGSTLVCQHMSKEKFPTSSLCVPMMAQSEALGVLHLRERPSPASQADEHIARRSIVREELALNVAGHIALALANLKLRETLRTQSLLDPLTGLYNRRYLKDSLEREVRRAARSQQRLAVIMLDVDQLKGFNDTFGHDAADSMLRELAAFFQKRIRGEDFACRYGGDEIVIILVETSLEAAERRAEQLREGIKRLTIPHGERYLKPPTVSLGVALYPEHGVTAEALLRVADEALYRAKSLGRDRIVVARESELN